MGERLGDTLIKSTTVYLDTHVVTWLAQGLMEKISNEAVSLMESADLLISPIVIIELEYLFEMGRTEMSSREVQLKIEHELNIRICNLPFSPIAKQAMDEKWTRDPFDRVIVAQAKVNGFSPLVSADEKVLKHYSMALS